MLWILTLISSLILYWIYDGYGRFLQILNLFRRMTRAAPTDVASSVDRDWPTITILVTVHNEATVIKGRIENLLQSDYPADRFSILVASDGSTDATNSIVKSFASDRVRLHESPGLGKTGTQNVALRSIDSDLVAFTDADVQFDVSWLKQIASRFRDARVGAVDGRLLYGSDATNAMQASQGFYWNYELKLRHLESQLGILAVVAGACFAVRRTLLLPMDPAIGEDCIVPLDVAVQGFRIVHEPKAKAFDSYEPDSAFTLRRRIRMTLRNWQGTWTRPQLLNPFRYPGLAFALWSHKLLRWLSPFFLAIATCSSLAMVMLQPSVVSSAIFAPFGLLFVLAACGWLSLRRRFQVPGAGTAYSFVLANAAFLIGICRAVTGHRIHSYRNA